MRYRYRADDEMKDSGVEWLGKIPKDWNIGRFKHFYSFGMGETILTENLEENGIPVYSATEGNIVLGFYNKAKLILEKGDIIIPARGNSIGSPKYVENKCTCTQTTIYAKRINMINSKYVYYFMIGSRKNLFYYDQTAIPQITTNQVRENNIIYSSDLEQEKIADFLDEKTSHFDLIISKKEELIKKLEEAKKSLISEVVTGKVKIVKTDDGYELVKRSSDEMKDSGVEWLSEIPKDWEVTKLKYLLSKIGSGKTPKGGAEVYQDEGVIFIRSQNVHNTGLRLEDVVYISHEVDEEMKSSRVQKQDILLNITGASIGRASIFELDNLDANVNQHVCILRSKTTNILPTLLNKIIQSDYIQAQIQSMQTGSSREGLNFEQIANMSLVISEDLYLQESIDACLDEKLNNMNSIISKTKLQIEKLKEAKQSLISEAVTGKIEILD